MRVWVQKAGAERKSGGWRARRCEREERAQMAGEETREVKKSARGRSMHFGFS